MNVSAQNLTVDNDILDEKDEIPLTIGVLALQGAFLTAFHPEPTNDTRFHQYFLGMVKQTLVQTLV